MTYDEATDAMNLMFWEYFKPRAEALLTYVPKVYWPLVMGSDTVPTDQAWCRVTRKTVSEELAGFSDRVRRYDVKVLYYVQLFYPVSDVWACKNLPKLAMFAKNSMQGMNDPTNVLWNRSVQIDELDAEKTWFRTNVVATFEYQEIRNPR